MPYGCGKGDPKAFGGSGGDGITQPSLAPFFPPWAEAGFFPALKGIRLHRGEGWEDLGAAPREAILPFQGIVCVCALQLRRGAACSLRLSKM